MPENIILPTNDLAFKKLFANNSYKEILKGLLQDFYDIAIKDIVIENPYSIDEFNETLNKDGYFAVEVDSFCVSESNWKFSAEMQLHSQRFYPERSLYYLCEKYKSTLLSFDLSHPCLIRQKIVKNKRQKILLIFSVALLIISSVT